MKIITTRFFSPIFLVFLISCRSLPVQEGTVVPTFNPTPASNEEALQEGTKLLQHAFSNCRNTEGKSEAYAFKGQYLLELANHKYEVIPRIPGPSPEELKKGNVWIGFIGVTAEVTSKYDIPNHQWTAAAGVEEWRFPLSKERSEEGPDKKPEWKWRCNACSTYDSLDCKRVKEYLEKAPR